MSGQVEQKTGCTCESGPDSQIAFRPTYQNVVLNPVLLPRYRPPDEKGVGTLVEAHSANELPWGGLSLVQAYVPILFLHFFHFTVRILFFSLYLSVCTHCGRAGTLSIQYI